MSHYACKYRIVYGDEWETCDAVITKENRLCDYHEIQSLKEELTKLRALVKDVKIMAEFYGGSNR